MLATAEDEARLAQWRAHAAAIYDDDFIAGLIGRYRNSDSAPAELIGELLRDAAVNYLSQKSDFDTPATLDSRQRNIDEIRRLAGKLESKINSLNKLDGELFWRPQRNGQFGILALNPGKLANEAQPKITLEELNALIDPERILERAPIDIPEPIRSPFGHLIRKIQIGDAGVVEWLQELQIMEALTILQNLADHAVARILYVKGKGGAPRRHAVRNWVAHMESIWTVHLRRRFTYSKNDGGSPAFLFCADAMAPLDSNVARSAVATAMRSAIKLTREVERGRAGKSARKNPAS